MTTNFDELMRQCDPAAGTPSMDHAARSRLLEAITSGSVTGGEASGTRRLRGGRPLRWLVAAAAVLTVALTGWQVLTPHGAEAHAQEVLLLAAENVTDVPTTPGQYWEITRHDIGVTGHCPGTDNSQCVDLYVEKYVTTRYVEVTGDGPVLVVSDPAELVQPITTDELAPSLPRIVSELPPPNATPGSWQIGSPAWMATLPREVSALRQELYAATGDDAGAFTYATDLMYSGLVPADLRAVLFQVMATIPGVTVADDDVTLDGRAGVALTHPGSDGAVEVLIDTGTGQLIGGLVHHPDYPDMALGFTITTRLLDAVPSEVLDQVEWQEHCEIGETNEWEC